MQIKPEPTNASSLDPLLIKPAFPRASGYDPNWLLENVMGPHVLWLTEWLTQGINLRSGMRVLDLGCGRAVSSIFLAKEFGVSVWAADLWIKPSDNLERIEAAHLSDRVFPVYAEAHQLPFAKGFFDAIISVDAYHYFGTDDLYLGYCRKFLATDGVLGIAVPGVNEELTTVPEHLKPYWDWEFWSFHSPAWWRRHWEKTGLMDVQLSDFLTDGASLWQQWNSICKEHGPPHFREPATHEERMLIADAGRTLGFTRTIARKLGLPA